MRYLGGGVGHQHVRPGHTHVEQLPTPPDEEPIDQSSDVGFLGQTDATDGPPVITPEDAECEDEEVDYGYVSDGLSDSEPGSADEDGDNGAAREDDADDIAALEGFASL